MRNTIEEEGCSKTQTPPLAAISCISRNVLQDKQLTCTHMDESMYTPMAYIYIFMRIYAMKLLGTIWICYIYINYIYIYNIHTCIGPKGLEPQPRVLAARQFPAFTDCAVKSPSGRKTCRWVEPRDIITKDEHTSPKATTNFSSLPCKIAAISSLRSRAEKDYTVYLLYHIVLWVSSLSYMNQETPCQREIVDPVGYHCMLVSSTFCTNDVRWRDPSALCPGMQFRSWLAADSGSAYHLQQKLPQHHRPVMAPCLLVCNCSGSLGSFQLFWLEVMRPSLFPR